MLDGLYAPPPRRLPASPPVDVSSPGDATWLLLGERLTPVPPVTAPRQERQAAMSAAFDHFCRSAFPVEGPEEERPSSARRVCVQQASALTHAYLSTAPLSPPPPDPARPAALGLLLLHDAQLLHVSWPASSEQQDGGPSATRALAELVSASDAAAASWRSASQYIEAMVDMQTALDRPRTAPPPPAALPPPAYVVKGFYHVASAGPFWDRIVQDQLRVLEGSGLLALSYSVDLLHIGRQRLDRSSLPAKVNVVEGGEDLSVYELPTLARLAAFCRRQPEARVFYLHNKGSTHGQPTAPHFLPVLDWRQYLEHFVVVRHRECLHAMDVGGFDTCGVNLHPHPAPHYSGNMWWARCSFINTLPPVAALDASDRFAAEFWMAQAPAWRAKVCFNTTHNMYVRRTLPHEYEHAPGCGQEPARAFWHVNTL